MHVRAGQHHRGPKLVRGTAAAGADELTCFAPSLPVFTGIQPCADCRFAWCSRAILPIRVFTCLPLRDPMLAHLAKIERRAASPTPETRHRESNADDPHEQGDDDPAGHRWKGTRSAGSLDHSHKPAQEPRCGRDRRSTFLKKRSLPRGDANPLSHSSYNQARLRWP